MFPGVACNTTVCGAQCTVIVARDDLAGGHGNVYRLLLARFAPSWLCLVSSR
jgi:hypothetical protein